MRRIVLKFGFLAGALLAAVMVVQFAFFEHVGFDYGMLVGYATMVVAFLFVFFGIRTYRDTVGEGTVAFGRAMQVGLLIVLVASACYVGTWEVVNPWLAPDFMQQYTAHELAKARAAGATAAQLAAQVREAEHFQALYRNPFVRVGMTFLEVFPVGLIMTLVSAGILRRRRPAPAEQRPASATSLAV